MSHTVHRRGSEKSLACDYPIIALTAKGINRANAGKKMKEVLRILLKYQPANASQATLGSIFRYTPEEMEDSVNDDAVVMGVFSDQAKLKAFLSELKERNIGISVVVSGLVDNVRDICSEVGLVCDSVNASAGTMGDLSKLPEEEILEITTMCGHAMISPGVVKETLFKVKTGRMTIAEASRSLASLCHCGIFNPERASSLIRTLLRAFCYDDM